MIVSIETKAKPCPGVEEAISRTEDSLRRGEELVCLGELIHNDREVSRLTKMGLRHITNSELDELMKSEENNYRFLVRTHGESIEILKTIREKGIPIVNTTCPIVKHSQKLVDQHVREGWGIIIVGDEDHAEVRGLMTRIRGGGSIISRIEDAETGEFDNRTLLIAQTTVDPKFFSQVRQTLSSRHARLKIVDTTCRFIRNRQKDVKDFSASNDVVIFVGGNKSSNCKLLRRTARTVNDSVYLIEKPEDVQKEWLHEAERVGISGGASTPRWQLEELRTLIEEQYDKKSLKGDKNRKGGKSSWWKWKKPNKAE